jgi:hypothetical protein
MLDESTMPAIFISALEAEGRQRQNGRTPVESGRPVAQETFGFQHTGLNE